MKLTKDQLKKIIIENLGTDLINEIGPLGPFGPTIARTLAKNFFKSLAWRVLKRLGWSLDLVGLSSAFFDTPMDERLHELFADHYGVDNEKALIIIENLSGTDKSWFLILHPELKATEYLDNNNAKTDIKRRLNKAIDKLYEKGREQVYDPKLGRSRLKRSKTWQGGVFAKDPGKIPLAIEEDDYRLLKQKIKDI